ncbi:sodium-coupled monocarboxylate transporter 1-like [Protobothrops mucrosquamatus]|uniref:sodium-coupled monocarboxylate transporter 1-like n=1 Tax=Protobothrops mucrosquamatus TaxID=103944 RepID=UPI0010FB906D|nr:sodium-coupled monocarboxylate transporter 1-like [Protobothrops mucrosquamatus]
MLLLSAVVGVFYAFEGVLKSHKDFLMADHNLSFLPVAFSLATSYMSALTVLGTPAEVYRFGSVFLLFAFSYAIMVVITAEVFLPVFYRLGLTSVYEYLELRYNKYMRILGTMIFIILTILYTSIVIYSPSLALNKVTGFQLWGSVIATGLICTFYCSVGGLKAVVWADVFQYILMIIGLGVVFAKAVIIKGGFGPILDDAYQGGRLNIWDFNPNPLKRHTVWTVVIGGTFTWVGMYATNQSQVQRYFACRSQWDAKCALYLNLVGLWIALIFASLDGLSMYSIYKDCDPLTSGIVSAPDQLMPYFVLDILEDYPGVPGLFVAGTFGASLSSVSTSINALATVTLEDFIKPYFTVSEEKLSYIAIGISLLFGIACLSMAALVSVMGALLQAAFSVFELIGGPLLGIYSLGILFPFANSKGAFSGFICGFCVIMWIGIGAQKYPPAPHRTVPLSLSIAGCQKSNDSAFVPIIVTSPSPAPSRSYLQEYWYSVSYLYFNTLGALITFIMGTIISLITGGLKKEVDHRLLFTRKDFMVNIQYWKNKFISGTNLSLPDSSLSLFQVLIISDWIMFTKYVGCGSSKVFHSCELQDQITRQLK